MISVPDLYELFLRHHRATTDTRQLQPGDLYFALRGERFNGNEFALDALAAGAAYAVVDDPEVAAADPRCLLTTNTLTTLQDLARHHRRQFVIPLIAIGGSNGKTTTKELVTAVLASHYRTHATRGNLNNHVGVPLTLLAMPFDAEVAVIELGANARGEIDTLCRIAEPTHGLVTNIGRTHLEGFGGFEGVKLGEGELYAYLAQAGGVAFVNADEPHLAELAAPVGRKIFYQQTDHIDATHTPFEVVCHATHPHIRYTFMSDRMLVDGTSNLAGAHNFQNVKSAVALGKYFKVPGEKIRAAIAAYVPANNRSQTLTQHGITFLLDAYNANPSSMQASLDSFAQLPPSRKAALLGHMLELGEDSPADHLLIARHALGLGFDELALVGPEFAAAAQQLGIRHFPDVPALRQWFQQQDWTGFHILLKGSRGIAMEKLLA